MFLLDIAEIPDQWSVPFAGKPGSNS